MIPAPGTKLPTSIQLATSHNINVRCTTPYAVVCELLTGNLAWPDRYFLKGVITFSISARKSFTDAFTKSNNAGPVKSISLAT